MQLELLSALAQWRKRQQLSLVRKLSISTSYSRAQQHPLQQLAVHHRRGARLRWFEEEAQPPQRAKTRDGGGSGPAPPPQARAQALFACKTAPLEELV